MVFLGLVLETSKVVHDTFNSLLADLVGKKLVNFLGRSGFKGLGGPHDSGMVRKIANDNKNYWKEKNSFIVKRGKTNCLI
jgi:hypothetical protein